MANRVPDHAGSELDKYGIFLADAPADLLATQAPRRRTWLPTAARWGIAALFLINGLTAIFKPWEFLPMVESNVILGELPTGLQEFLVRSAVVHDFGIAALVLSRRNDSLALLWMGLWMGSIAATKAMNLVLV